MLHLVNFVILASALSDRCLRERRTYPMKTSFRATVSSHFLRGDGCIESTTAGFTQTLEIRGTSLRIPHFRALGLNQRPLLQTESVMYHLSVPLLCLFLLKLSHVHQEHSHVPRIPLRPLHDEELVIVGDPLLMDVIMANRMIWKTRRQDRAFGDERRALLLRRRASLATARSGPLGDLTAVVLDHFEHECPSPISHPVPPRYCQRASLYCSRARTSSRRCLSRACDPSRTSTTSSGRKGC